MRVPHLTGVHAFVREDAYERYAHAVKHWKVSPAWARVEACLREGGVTPEPGRLSAQFEELVETYGDLEATTTHLSEVEDGLLLCFDGITTDNRTFVLSALDRHWRRRAPGLLASVFAALEHGTVGFSPVFGPRFAAELSERYYPSDWVAECLEDRGYRVTMDMSDVALRRLARRAEMPHDLTVEDAYPRAFFHPPLSAPETARAVRLFAPGDSLHERLADALERLTALQDVRPELTDGYEYLNDMLPGVLLTTREGCEAWHLVNEHHHNEMQGGEEAVHYAIKIGPDVKAGMDQLRAYLALVGPAARAREDALDALEAINERHEK